jgi:Fic family protein
LSENTNITESIIIRVFNQIKETNAGYRPSQAKVIIKRGQSEFRSGDVIYTPPPREEGIIKKLMGNLVEYLNDDEKYPDDPLLKMCIAHYQFEAIHPYARWQWTNGKDSKFIVPDK